MAEGEVLLTACRTDWRRWNQRPEELKTAALLRSELETTQALPVWVKNGNVYVSTLTDFNDSAKGFRTLSQLLRNAGVPCQQQPIDVKGEGIARDPNNLLLDPSVDTSKKATK
jgi:beta-galactosidase